jgi:hypothetical protein
VISREYPQKKITSDRDDRGHKQTIRHTFSLCLCSKHKHKTQKKVCLKNKKNSNIFIFKSDLSKIIKFKENLFVKTFIKKKEFISCL